MVEAHSRIHDVMDRHFGDDKRPVMTKAKNGCFEKNSNTIGIK